MSLLMYKRHISVNCLEMFLKGKVGCVCNKELCLYTYCTRMHRVIQTSSCTATCTTQLLTKTVVIMKNYHGDLSVIFFCKREYMFVHLLVQ